MIDLELREDRQFHWLINIGLMDHAMIYGGGDFTMDCGPWLMGYRTVFITNELKEFTQLGHHGIEGFYVYI